MFFEIFIDWNKVAAFCLFYTYPLVQKDGPPPPKYIFFIFSMIFVYFYRISEYEDPNVSFFTPSEIFFPKG